MTIQILLKIGAVGILVALLNQILKHSGKEEHAYLLNLAGLIIVLSWVIPYISDLFNEIMDIVNIVSCPSPPQFVPKGGKSKLHNF